MVLSARRAGAIAAVLLCVVMTAPALAQRPGPFSEPLLRTHPKNKLSGATPTPTATPTATATATATPTATATATPTPGPDEDLPDTGTDAVRVALAGLTLLGFGLSLRLGLADVRRRPV